VSLALWWLLRGDTSPSIVILHEGDALPPAASEKFRAWFKTDLGLQRIYPWILFGPYVALIALIFPLEQGRLRLNLLVNLAGCAAFVAGSNTVNSRVNRTGARVVIVNSQHEVKGPGAYPSTNTTYVKIISSEPPKLLEDQLAKTFPLPPNDESWRFPNQSSDSFRSGPSNALAQIAHHWGPPPGLLGAPKFNGLSLFLDFLAYSAILGLAHSVHFYRRFREREHRALLLESGLAQARLNALRAQLQPHFLFNSLNAIASLLRRDPRLAEATLMSLSDLLRLALSQSERQEVALRDELNLVERYLEIQHTRFGDKLRIEQDIEVAALESKVPTLLLQPLVENAIRHGLEPAEHAVLVRLGARRDHGMLVLWVEDNGVGLAKANALEPKPVSASANCGDRDRTPDPVSGNGIGLKNLRARLETLYGDDQSLELAERPEGGVIVRVQIPWRTIEQAELSCSPNQK
jgi:signal transduction histidine kinase